MTERVSASAGREMDPHARTHAGRPEPRVALPLRRRPWPLSRPQCRDQESNDPSEGLFGDAAHEGVDEVAVDREELQGANLTALSQATLRHRLLVQGDRIAASGELGRHGARHDVLAVDNQDEGRAALDRRQVRKGKGDYDERPRAESQWNHASCVVPHVVLGVLPHVLQGLFGRAEERGKFVFQDPLNVGLLSQYEGISRLQEDEVRIPTEPVPLSDLLRNHDLALARHLHDVHRL